MVAEPQDLAWRTRCFIVQLSQSKELLLNKPYGTIASLQHHTTSAASVHRFRAIWGKNMRFLGGFTHENTPKTRKMSLPEFASGCKISSPKNERAGGRELKKKDFPTE